MKTALLLSSVVAIAGCSTVIDIPARKYDCSFKIRILYDKTGPTKEISVPFFKGEEDLIKEINDAGGVGADGDSAGCKIQYIAEDYGYAQTGAQQYYDAWKASADWDDVVAILGWGSTDSLLLAPQVREDRKPFLSASYFAGLAAPEPVAQPVLVPEVSDKFSEVSFPSEFKSDGFAYNFFAGTDYSTSARIAMFHVHQQSGTRIGFFHCSAAYCTGPIPAARTYAKDQKVALGRDLVIELTDTADVINTKIDAYFKEEMDHATADTTYKPVDWVWSGNTVATTVSMAKAVAAANAKYGLSVQIMSNVWGMDESMPPLCGPLNASNPCFDRVHVVLPFAAYGDTRAAEMTKVLALHDKRRLADNDGSSYRNVRYVQGYTNVLLLKMAVEKILADNNAITGENIKAALETFSGKATAGLTNPLTFTSTDHRPQSGGTIYKFDVNGKLVLEFERNIAMQGDWLGW